jgi:hypothetical protein
MTIPLYGEIAAAKNAPKYELLGKNTWEFGSYLVNMLHVWAVFGD